ncbi:hypothetical protein DKX38_005475 [Salix brachista]|uniref:Uncharacterized protein n=1 Tax=Salix brachista TaxID=2182728 RepID=A0A5N5N0L2_9ROSI|nr:hypothetical protein DKX38_005475 [Salix brachista]
MLNPTRARDILCIVQNEVLPANSRVLIHGGGLSVRLVHRVPSTSKTFFALITSPCIAFMTWRIGNISTYITSEFLITLIVSELSKKVPRVSYKSTTFSMKIEIANLTSEAWFPGLQWHGGGGLYIPILTIVVGFDLKTASSSSVFMVTGGTIANVMQWLITILFAVFLASSTFKTCKNVVFHWKLESEEVERNGCGNLENGMVKNEASSKGSGEVEGVKEPLLGVELTWGSIFPVEEVLY